jgi:transketolase
MTKNIKMLENIAKEVRRDVLKATSEAEHGHPGGSLSCVELLVALYFNKMRHNPKNPKWKNRDIFILDKGHAAPTLYKVLSKAGYFPASENSYAKLDSGFEGHPVKDKCPGIEVSTGSLAQGLSIGNGLALAAKLDKKKSKVYVLIGDGTLNEGQVWEAAMTASHYKLNNLVCIIDRNKFQLDGSTEKIKSVEPIAEKWKAFGWNVIEIDAHNFKEILSAFKRSDKQRKKPTVIIANSVKGKGISFMENDNYYHHITLQRHELMKALKEL